MDAPSDSSAAPGVLTTLLAEWATGDIRVIDRLLPLIYPEMRRIAGIYMAGERPGHTLQPTALVNEAYLKLVAETQRSYTNRVHFLAVAARVMRQILVDHARSLGAEKRGFGQKVPIEFAEPITPQHSDAIILDDVLKRLSTFDNVKSEMLELRYFGGLTHEEIAEFKQFSVSKVKRELRFAESWLKRELRA